MYSSTIFEHFEHPRNVGELPEADAEGEDENPICGDRLHLWLRITEDRIECMTWQAEGCAPAMAAASILSEMVTGLSVHDAGLLGRDEVSAALGGLPARKSHAALLAVSTLRKALNDFTGSERAAAPPDTKSPV